MVRRLTLVLLILLGVGGLTDAGLVYTRYVAAAPDAPTPGPGGMTVYQVVNPNAAPLLVVHEIQNVELTPVFAFEDTVAANGSAQYHARDMAAIPTGFEGQVALSADSPFAAEVVGYDYPPSVTPTATATATPTQTATPTSTPTPTRVTIVLPFRR